MAVCNKKGTKTLTWSFRSFGEEASTINMIPSLRVRLGGSIYGVDTTMEQCNHPQIMNEYEVETRQGAEFCFNDGKKEVCNKKLLKEYCGKVGDEWGLRDVYC